VMFGPCRGGELAEDVGSAFEGVAGFLGVAGSHPGVCLGFLQGELNHGAAGSGYGLASLSGVDDVFEAAFGDGEPGGHLKGPAHEFGVTGVAAHLVGGLAGGFGFFAFA
jgi:hypothetical protein